MKIKIIIVDDDKLITESMKIILEMDERFYVVGIAENGKDAVLLCKNNDVDIALLDVRMPIMNGVDATAIIVSETKTKVLILSTFDEDEFIAKAFHNGASGYLLKKNPPEQIKNAIFSIYGGNAVLQDSILAKMESPLIKKDDKERLEILTNREIDIVKAISEGLTNKEISEKLFLSEGTVKNNVSVILSKLQLKHRTQIAIFYLQK